MFYTIMYLCLCRLHIFTTVRFAVQHFLPLDGNVLLQMTVACTVCCINVQWWCFPVLRSKRHFSQSFNFQFLLVSFLLFLFTLVVDQPTWFETECPITDVTDKTFVKKSKRSYQEVVPTFEVNVFRLILCYISLWKSGIYERSSLMSGCRLFHGCFWQHATLYRCCTCS